MVRYGSRDIVGSSHRSDIRSEPNCVPTFLVLIVDDDPEVTDRLSADLAANGFQALTANDADTASRLALRNRPDVLLLDLDMPRYTGLELYQALQLSKRGRMIPVVFLVGDSRPDQRQLALSQGACGVIAKPCNLPELLETLEQVVRNGRLNTPSAETSPSPTGNGTSSDCYNRASRATNVGESLSTTGPVAVSPAQDRGSRRSSAASSNRRNSREKQDRSRTE